MGLLCIIPTPHIQGRTVKVVELKIQNFRGIETAELKFDGHALLLGVNNVGKSTICEALDLVLGPDRLNRFPPIEEWDFYNGKYLEPPSAEGEDPKPTEIKIEVLLIELSAEVEKRCAKNLEFWHIAEKRLLTEGEAQSATPGIAIPCLRLETVGLYDPDEDEFGARTYYTHTRFATIRCIRSSTFGDKGPSIQAECTSGSIPRCLRA
jgi:putative ATP-dependent endonuclease of OLD family